MTIEYQINEMISFLKSKNIYFDKGLTNSEITVIQNNYGFVFPPDLRLLLQTEMPISGNFVDWRRINKKHLEEKLNWPLEGICFDIKHNNFWMQEFGTKPETFEEAFEVVKKYLTNVPKLIPIYGHRYLPDQPNEVGNPVLSIYQTDIIYYGSDLNNYFRNELASANKFGSLGKVKPVPFWSKIAD